MSRQLVFASTAEILDLLRTRRSSLGMMRQTPLRDAMLATQPGPMAIVHDPEGVGAVRAGRAMPLVLGATRSTGDVPVIELVLSPHAATSIYNRMTVS